MCLNQILRSLLRDRLNTLVIIVSLAVGISCISLITIFISRELNTDGFHENKERIYALKSDDPWLPGKKMYQCKVGSAEYMKSNIARVEDFCRVANSGSQKLIANNTEYLDSPPFIRASQNFFSFFSYKLLTNNRESALESPNSIVISAELAKKYFGKDDPVGKIITVVNSNKTEQMVVSGIFEKPVENTQIVFDMVRLIGEADSRCYVRLAKNAGIEEVEKLFLEKKELIPVINDGKPGPYYLESLQSAYFDTTRGSFVESSRNKTDLLIALIIGLMIIGIATFNFLGILTNKFRGKIKEYYIRRINGSSVNRLIALFMLENSIISGVSFIFSIFLIQDALPFFNELTGTNIPEIFISQSRQIMILLAILTIILLSEYLRV